jgi:hypothetical protein
MKKVPREKSQMRQRGCEIRVGGKKTTTREK